MDQTLFVSAVVCSLCFLMAIAMLPFAAREPNARAALPYGIGFLLVGTSVLSYVLHPGLISAPAQTLLRSALVLAGFTMLWASAWIRCARPVPVPLFMLVLGPWMCAFALYLVSPERPLLRFGLAALSIAAGCAASGWCLWRHKRPRNAGDTGAVAVLAFGAVGEAWIATGALLLGFDEDALLESYGVVAPVLFVGLGSFVFQSYTLDAMTELSRRACTDPLTGLLNRRAFDERLALALAHALRYRRPLSVVIADLDHFKRINDTHGHATGDRVLVAFARLLQSGSRSADTVARIGGEEFAIIMPEADAARAAGYADRLRRAARRVRVATEIDVTASFGVADLASANGDAAALLARADAALYAAKARGRNCVAHCAELAAA